MRIFLSFFLLVTFISGSFAQENRLSHINDFLYQTREADLYRISHLKYDLLITDYSFDGTEVRAYTADEIAGLQYGMGDETLVIATLSLSIAEDHRWYWTEGDLPEWVDVPDDWDETGRYPVDIANPEWQDILFTFIDKITDAGFDGVYLTDLPEDSPELAYALIFSLADYGRAWDEGFLVIVQGGLDLAIYGEDYFSFINGVMVEGMYYGREGEDIPADEDDILDMETALQAYFEAEIPVFMTAFTTDPAQIADHYARASDIGAIPFATVETLDAMTVNEGFGPD